VAAGLAGHGRLPPGPGDHRRGVKERIGGSAPKQVELWPDLPRSKIGKVLKPEIKTRMSAG
jgi:hypothetical protein